LGYQPPTFIASSVGTLFKALLVALLAIVLAVVVAVPLIANPQWLIAVLLVAFVGFRLLRLFRRK